MRFPSSPLLGKANDLAVGTVEEVRNSDNERIQSLLNRKFEEEEPDPEEYLARLMGQDR